MISSRKEAFWSADSILPPSASSIRLEVAAANASACSKSRNREAFHWDCRSENFWVLRAIEKWLYAKKTERNATGVMIKRASLSLEVERIIDVFDFAPTVPKLCMSFGQLGANSPLLDRSPRLGGIVSSPPPRNCKRESADNSGEYQQEAKDQHQHQK